MEVLSGGERGRLALACLALSSANLLLLDEPSNHLDLPSQEILQTVLAEFGGTILLVSHDRYLIDALSTQIWEVDPEQAALRVFEGTYSEYRAVRQAEQEASKQEAAAARAEAAREIALNRPARANSNRERQRKQRLSDLETEIVFLEAQIEAVSRKLENPPPGASAVVKLAKEYEQFQHTLDERMEEWARLSEETPE